MKTAVRAAFSPFSDAFEGHTPYLYTDSVGLVTTARGNLVDPGPRRIHTTDPIGGSNPSLCHSLGWTNGFGLPASVQEIDEAFWVVKHAWPGVQSAACQHITQLRLPPAALDRLTFTKLDEMWAVLVGRFIDLESAPADAQLGIVSMAWAAGDEFVFPKFDAAFLRRDWATCAAECQMLRQPVPVRRNAANHTLFTNAFAVARDGLDPNVLHYPATLA